jgi:hypothetical protein
MFVRYYLELPLPAARVEQALLGSSTEWLSALAGDAEHRGGELLAQVGVGPLGARLRRRVAVSLAAPVRFPSMTSLPLAWEPIGMEALLPRLEADLEVGPLGEERTQLAISARYSPPLGAVGARWTGCCCTASPRRPSRTSSTGWVRRSSPAVLARRAAAGGGRPTPVRASQGPLPLERARRGLGGWMPWTRRFG